MSVLDGVWWACQLPLLALVQMAQHPQQKAELLVDQQLQ